jgi:hypothetical protein
MRRTVHGFVLLAACLGAGCLHLPLHSHNSAKQPDAPAKMDDKVARPRAPITADQVNENNGHEMANTLRDELDRESGMK